MQKSYEKEKMSFKDLLSHKEPKTKVNDSNTENFVNNQTITLEQLNDVKFENENLKEIKESNKKSFIFYIIAIFFTILSYQNYFIYIDLKNLKADYQILALEYSSVYSLNNELKNNITNLESEIAKLKKDKTNDNIILPELPPFEKLPSTLPDLPPVQIISSKLIEIEDMKHEIHKQQLKNEMLDLLIETDKKYLELKKIEKISSNIKK